jgi:hypothetical protein
MIDTDFVEIYFKKNKNTHFILQLIIRTSYIVMYKFEGFHLDQDCTFYTETSVTRLFMSF